MEWFEVRKNIKVSRFVNYENSDEYKLEYLPDNKILITFNGEFLTRAKDKSQAERFVQSHIDRYR